MRPPDPHRSRDIRRRDPFPVGGVPGDGDGVGVLAVHGDVLGVCEGAQDHGSAVGVKEGVGFGVAGDEDSSAAFRRGGGGVGFRQLRHC